MSGETEAQLRARIAELEAEKALVKAAEKRVTYGALSKLLDGIGEDLRTFISERTDPLESRLAALEARFSEREGSK